MPKISQIAGTPTSINGGESIVLNQSGTTYTASLSDVREYTDSTLRALSASDFAILTDGKIDASVIPDELDVRLSVLKDTRLNLRESMPGDGELVVDSDTNEILVGDGTGKLFRGYQQTPLTFLTTESGGVSAYNLTTIPEDWQRGNNSLFGLVIGSSVTSIGDYAFGFSDIIIGSLVIPDSVTSIGSGAFFNCVGFTGSLVIPDSVTSIESGAFSACSGFTGSLVIPDSVTSIGSYAFDLCQGFTGSLVIPDSVTSIESGAFSACSGFTGSLVIPDSVTSIGSYAFSTCTGLDNVYANLSASSFPSTALFNTGTGTLFITPPFISSYGGLSASWGSKTVGLWDNYPSVP